MEFHGSRVPRTLRTGLAATFACALALAACGGEKTPSPGVTTDSVRVLPSRGSVEVLNGTPLKGAASVVAERLRDQGFDVVRVGNAPDQNHPRTLVVERHAGAPTASEIAKALGLKRAYPFRNENLLVDATVYVGRDIQETLP